VAVLVNNAGVFAYGGGRKLGSFKDGRSRPTKNFAVTANGCRGEAVSRKTHFQPATQDEVI
jgi:hypothetical protein